MNHPIYFISLFLIASGVLAFMVFIGIGALCLFALAVNGGNLLDLFRIRIANKPGRESRAQHFSLHSQAANLSQPTTAPPDLAFEDPEADRLALALAAGLDAGM